MSQPKRYLVTSALPYANGPQHLGHLAGAYLPADIFVRFLRLLGKDVVYVCGSDEHGAAITIQAKKEGISPRDIIDKYHQLHADTFKQMGISFDIYHRTSEAIHHQTSQAFFKKLYEQGDQFEEKTSEQYYDEDFDQFLADRYITGECPRCGYGEAYGDQCENCGSDLSPTELINPKSTMSGKTPKLKETKHWYFKLNDHEAWLKEWVETGRLEGKAHHNPKEWKKHVVGQCLSWLDNGLHPRSITRDLDWGIKVPLEDAEGKVLYVWFDAPIGYISATKQWCLDNGKPEDEWKKYWQDEESELIHFIGKDNIVFHCIVFPSMLKAHGDYLLPVNVPANQFLNFEGQKFSKSRGWGIQQFEYLDAFKDFPNKEDAMRYALIRNMPENKDADFKWDDFVEFHDNELVANLGNFINRVVVLTNKYYNGTVPTPADENWKSHWQKSLTHINDIIGSIEKYSFKNAIQQFMELSSYGNTYLQDVSPWKLWKDDPESNTVSECMFVCNQIVALLSVACQPFLPFTSDKIRQLINLSPVQNGDLAAVIDLLEKGEPLLQPGHHIGEPSLLFAKINDKKDSSRKELIESQKAKLAALLESEASKEFEPVKVETSFDDFTKMDIRTGTIVQAEKMPKANKLLKLEVDLGFEKRTVVSGIAKFYKPEEIIGQKVLVLANLAPRKLRGVESQGMILMAENEKGELAFVSPPKEFGDGFTVR